MTLKFIYLAFVLMYPSYSNGNVDEKQHSNPSKKMIVEDIIQKITNLTQRTFARSADKDKAKVLRRLHDVLVKVTKVSGVDPKYVDLIMRGINITASNISSTLTKRNDTEVKIDNQSIGLSININSSNAHDSKQNAANKIANKIDKLVTKYLKLVSTPEDKIDILEKIRTKVMDSAYTDVKYRANEKPGIPTMMQNYTSVINVHRRIMDEDADNLIQEAKALQDNKLKDGDDASEVMADDDLFPKRDPSCVVFEEHICQGAEELKNFQCFNGKIIATEKLCDGEANCADNSDEINCATNVKEKIDLARMLISNVNISVARKCFSPNVSKIFRNSDANVLNDALKSQMIYVNQLWNILWQNLQSPALKPKPIEIEKGSVSERFRMSFDDVSVLLSTISLTVARSLCVKNPDDSEFRVEDIMEGPMELILSPKCICKGQFCENKNCNLNGSPCKRICWQRYNLNSWGCQASNGGTSVSLNEICDGKLDCFDETDEKDCITGSQRTRFEAVEAYNSVLEIIFQKTNLKEYGHVRNNLLILYNLVKKMQKSSIKSSVDPQEIKELRDEIFAKLQVIYEDTYSRSTVVEIDKTYDFLLSINEQLIEAMKQSHTGNKANLPVDKCICREGHCILPRCTKKCTQACLIEPRLKRFTCLGTGGNVTVPISAICNQKQDCPNGDDEDDCKKGEICRSHHYVVLRHNLRDVGENKKGTALGEVLVAWKTMATADLIVAEDNRKITPMIFAERVGSLLDTLMRAYSNMDGYKHNDYIGKEFEKIAAIVIKALKSCGK